MAEIHYQRIAQLRDAQSFRAYLQTLGLDAEDGLPFDETVLPAPDGVLAQAYPMKRAAPGRRIGNRFCVLPMEAGTAQLTDIPQSSPASAG